MQIILDLDLDFFVSPIARNPPRKRRLPESDFNCASTDDVAYFLENCCGLSESAPIPGRQFGNHHHSFKTWRRWLADGTLKAPFGVVHVDAHADLGFPPCPYWTYLVSELLSRPLPNRCNPKVGDCALSPSNYLLFAIANHWISRLTYVYPKARREIPPNGAPDDVWDELFKNRDLETGLIELKCYDPAEAKSVLAGRAPQALSTERPVPFVAVRAANFAITGFTHMVVAQSRRYTPKSADRLLPVIRKYFKTA